MITDEQRQQASRPLQGLSIPFRIDPGSGRVAVTTGADKLGQNIRHLLLTDVGERLMNREYGGGARQLLFESIDDGILEVAKHQIARALVRYEPRVIPQELTVAEGEPGQLIIRLTYIQAQTPGLQTVALTIE